MQINYQVCSKTCRSCAHTNARICIGYASLWSELDLLTSNGFFHKSCRLFAKLFGSYRWTILMVSCGLVTEPPFNLSSSPNLSLSKLEWNCCSVRARRRYVDYSSGHCCTADCRLPGTRCYHPFTMIEIAMRWPVVDNLNLFSPETVIHDPHLSLRSVATNHPTGSSLFRCSTVGRLYFNCNLDSADQYLTYFTLRSFLVSNRYV